MTSAALTPERLPTAIEDPVNAAILAVAEDRLVGFHPEPFAEIAARTGLPLGVVTARIAAMLRYGRIRRVRQTLITTSLAPGALVAWQVPEERLQAAFDTLHRDDPFTGHVVIRTAENATPGARFRLWTTLKVPQGFSLDGHARLMAARIGALTYRLMPAKMLFALGVGHVRRRTLEPGARAEAVADPIRVQVEQLTGDEWRALEVLKPELSPAEIRPGFWQDRATAAGIPFDRFVATAQSLAARGLLGRFSTFLEHVKPGADGQRVTRYNALFHWRVPAGRELAAGQEVGRHHVMTHAYWREGGPEFQDVNVMGVAHGTDRDLVLAHKAAIDAHLAEAGIAVGYTNVFWGGRSEIKPSEILPSAYERWCRETGAEPDRLRAPRVS